MRAFGVLRSSVDLLAPSRTGNGKGGTRSTYDLVGTVAGEVYAGVREALEKNEGGSTTVEQQVEFSIDTSVVEPTGQMRIRTADQKVFEILSLSLQSGFAFGRARRVNV